MCSTRTVLRALAWLELFGFLGRIRRLARVRTPLGRWPCRQTSNAYRVTTRLAGLGAMAMNVFAGRERHNFAPSIEKAQQEGREIRTQAPHFPNFRVLKPGRKLTAAIFNFYRSNTAKLSRPRTGFPGPTVADAFATFG